MPDPDRLEARPTLFRRKLETLNAKPETELTARERRGFTQPLWRQALSVLTIDSNLNGASTSRKATIPRMPTEHEGAD